MTTQSSLSSPPILSSLSYCCPCQSILSPSNERNDHHENNELSHNDNDDNNSKTYCPTCIRKMLLPTIQRHEQMLEKRNSTRVWCTNQLLKYRTSKNMNDDDNKNENDDDDDDDDDLIISSSTTSHDKHHNNNDYNDHSSSSSISSTIEYYRDELSTYNQKLKELKEECNNKSILSATNTVHIEQWMSGLEEDRMKIQNIRFGLNHLYDSILVSNDDADDGGGESSMKVPNNENGNLISTINTHVNNVKQRRFQLALQVFDMHRMDVGEEYNQLTFNELLFLSTNDPKTAENNNNNKTANESSNNNSEHNETTSTKHNNTKKKSTTAEIRFKRRIHDKQPNGIGKVCNMPLPHAGQELFGVLPHDMLTSSLRLVASMTNLLARCLGIVLPHPILLRPILITTSFPVKRMSGKRDLIHEGETMNISHNSKSDIKSSSKSSSWKKSILLKSRKNSKTASSYTKSIDAIKRHDAELMKIEELMLQETGDIITSCTNSQHDNLQNDLSKSITTIKDLEILDQEIAGNRNFNEGEEESLRPMVDSSSTTSLMSLVGSSSNMLSRHARRALDKMKGYHDGIHAHKQKEGDDSIANKFFRPMDKASISQRLNHASCAIICESNKSISKQKEIYQHAAQGQTKAPSSPLSISSLVQYELRPPRPSVVHREEVDREKEKFIVGLQLLQNDIIALSIQAGVPVATLWPAEAMLLNLYSLKLYCLNQVGL